ncbi:hypothetical protein E2C01_085170 [Portunus trituberculatus]|uniref:Uncharacterized protein n=1 Tax=Portunus trituberculatus TaxID=210409 RepID=A0A5B7J843_PORTR|nr:hypothetical protein [Portunus trituberculatus]
MLRFIATFISVFVKLLVAGRARVRGGAGRRGRGRSKGIGRLARKETKRFPFGEVPDALSRPCHPDISADTPPPPTPPAPLPPPPPLESTFQPSL